MSGCNRQGIPVGIAWARAPKEGEIIMCQEGVSKHQ